MLKSNRNSGSIDDLFGSTAMESFFSTPVEELLAKVKENVETNCNTPEECDDMAAVLTDETRKFNDAMERMIAAAEALQSGSISQDDMNAVVAPAIAELKASCKMLGLDPADADGDSTIPSDEEVVNLRAFLQGSNEIINRRKIELSDCASAVPNDVEQATESFISAFSDMIIY